MAYNYYQKTPYEYNEFVSRELCSENPNISSLQEVILIYLKEMAYYLLKLKEFGAENEVIKNNILEAISGIITNVDYNPQQFQRIISILAQDLAQAKTLYAKLCQKENIEAKFFKIDFKHPKNADINEIIKRGERYYIKRNAQFNYEQKNLFDVIILLIKRLCLKIIQIKSYNKNYDNAYNKILILLNTLNFDEVEVEDIKAIIKDSDLEYYYLLKALYNAQEEAHGKRESVYIPFSPRVGKAILVSGIDLTQLQAVLEYTKAKGVDVYTHGMTMLMAHTLSKFREYTHLAGHFGKNYDNGLFDFAAFPGAILMTRYLFQKVQYLYRGRLFTTDDFAPGGVVKIKDHNYEPLIQAALKSKGFTKEQPEVILRVGFRQKEMEEKINELVTRMEKNEIKRLYFIGILNHESEYKEYFNKFFKLMPKDCYAVSLSQEKSTDNIFHIDSFYDYLLIYKIFEKFNEIKPLNQLKITVFITKCDQYTISNIISFINIGIKSIYLCRCVPTIVNPAMFETMKTTFGIHGFSNPEQDIKDTLSE